MIYSYFVHSHWNRGAFVFNAFKSLKFILIYPRRYYLNPKETFSGTDEFLILVSNKNLNGVESVYYVLTFTIR